MYNIECNKSRAVKVDSQSVNVEDAVEQTTNMVRIHSHTILFANWLIINTIFQDIQIDWETYIITRYA